MKTTDKQKGKMIGPEHYEKQGINYRFWLSTVIPAVLKRDNNTCQKCGRKENLDVHHKIPGIQDIDNLITLCRSCHKKEHCTNVCACGHKHYPSGECSGCGCEQFKPKKNYKPGLKTLKDLENSWLESTTKGKGWKFVSVKVLKQEAIKWVKTAPEDGEMDDICVWIKTFFNITEEELSEDGE